MKNWIKLKYGNTNTFYIPGDRGGVLVDTDYAGTLPAFYKALKRSGLQVKDIAYVLATHYHPDHGICFPISAVINSARAGTKIASVMDTIQYSSGFGVYSSICTAL